MVKTGSAADCDYKEARRRETAVHFVVDAFNGKVESILSHGLFSGICFDSGSAMA